MRSSTSDMNLTFEIKPTQVEMERRAAVATFAVTLYPRSFLSCVSAACTHVEHTSDKCGAGHILLDVTGLFQQFVINDGKTRQINLEYSLIEIYRYCESSRELTAWGEMANRLDVTFQSEGAIDWWVYKCIPGTFMDRTYDSCGGQNFIQVLGQKINKPSYSRVIKLPGLQSQVFWYCRLSNELASNTSKMAG